MPTGVGTGEAARRPGTTRQTILNKIKAGHLVAQQVGGAKGRWSIDEDSLQRYSQEAVKRGGLRRASNATEIFALKSRVAALEQAIERRTSASGDPDLGWADLQAEVVALREALIRTQAVIGLQEQAANERAVVAEHLAAAIAAALRTDSIQRQVVADLHEALGSITRPRHPGDVVR